MQIIIINTQLINTLLTIQKKCDVDCMYSGSLVQYKKTFTSCKPLMTKIATHKPSTKSLIMYFIIHLAMHKQIRQLCMQKYSRMYHGEKSRKNI